MEDGADRPIAYPSRTLSSAEKKYCQLEKEGLAVVYGVKKFHQYLYGRKFTIFSDHQPLKYLFSESRQTSMMASSRIQRWALTLSAYDYTIQHRPGSKLGNADALSRVPLKEGPTTVPEPADLVLLVSNLSKSIVTAEQIKAWTEKDPVLSRVYSQVQFGWSITEPNEDLKSYLHRKDELSVLKGCVLWGARVIVPPQGRLIILDQLHETHPGISRMKSLARCFVWWPGMNSEIESKVKNCEQCQLYRSMPAKAPIHPWEWPSKPWARVHMDHAGPYLGKLFLILIDAHSKWIEAHIVSLTAADVSIAKLRSVFAIHGIPEQLVSDNGSGFSSEEFKIFTQENGIHHTFTSPYHPASNGLAERAVQTVKGGIAKMEGDIGLRLDRFLMTYRVTPQASTGVSPAELLMGRRLRTRLDRIHPDAGSTVIKKQEKQEENSIRPGKGPRQFAVKDRLYARNYIRGIDKWIPVKVIKVTGLFHTKL